MEDRALPPTEDRAATPSGPSPAVSGIAGIPSAGAILAAVGKGSRTFRVAKRLACSTAKARYHLKKLEREHLVFRHPRYSYDNDIYWITGE